ncbi:hypothetical protein Dimus_021310 [Dionaea muscipula]
MAERRSPPPSPPPHLDPMFEVHEEPESPPLEQDQLQLKKRKIDVTKEEYSPSQQPREQPLEEMPPPPPPPPQEHPHQPLDGKQQEQHPLPKVTLEDCLKLLRRKDDEHRLKGLRLLPRVCPSNDHISLRRVCGVFSFRFLDRLFRSGMREDGDATAKDQRILYLRLYVMTLQLFSKIPEMAADEYMVSKIPSIIQIMERESSPRVLCLCYDTLYNILFESKHGVTKMLEAGGANILASQLPSLASGSHKCALSAMGLMELIFCNVSHNVLIMHEYLKEQLTMVDSIARQVAFLQNDHKLDLMYLMSSILSSPNLKALHHALSTQPNGELQTYIRAGVVHTLENNTGPFDKWTALLVVNSLVSMLGKIWFVGEVYAPETRSSIPSNSCLFLVLAQSKVEITSLLDDLRGLDLEARPSKTPAISSNLENLRIVFFLVDKIIEVVLDFKDDEVHGDDHAILILELNDTINLVLGHINDVKGTGRIKGDDLVYCVLLVGNYLGKCYRSVPFQYRDKAVKLLDFMLFVEPSYVSSNYMSVLALLPVVCEITSDTEGAAALVSSEGYKAVVNCLVEILHSVDCPGFGKNPSISYASTTLLNLLLEQKKSNVFLDGSDFVPLLEAFAEWAEEAGETHLILLTSSVCSLILETTSEEDLLHQEINSAAFHGLSQLILRSMDVAELGRNYPLLKEIVVHGYPRWCHRFPSIKKDVGDGFPW